VHGVVRGPPVKKITSSGEKVKRCVFRKKGVTASHSEGGKRRERGYHGGGLNSKFKRGPFDIKHYKETAKKEKRET